MMQTNLPKIRENVKNTQPSCLPDLSSGDFLLPRVKLAVNNIRYKHVGTSFLEYIPEQEA